MPLRNRRVAPLESWWKVEDRGYKTPCWIWQGGTNNYRYGMHFSNRKVQPAHRIVFEKYTGIVIPYRKQLDHLCRIRLCVNPEHLEIVDLRTNCQRGNQAKLTREEVYEIKDLLRHTRFKQEEIANFYNIHQTTVSTISRGVAWK